MLILGNVAGIALRRRPGRNREILAAGRHVVGRRRARWRRSTGSTRSASPTSATRPAPASSAAAATRRLPGRWPASRILDVGCGAGLAAEPLARLGAAVTGIDPSPRDGRGGGPPRAETGAAGIAYEAATLDEVAASGRRFDLVLALEVVEHVPDVPAFLAAAAEAARPGGLVVLSTLSRTLASFAGAIVGAEYLLGWLPRGTHSWRAFLTPAELARHLRRVGLRPVDVAGVSYRADRDEFRLSRDTGVNYMLAATRS
jgi:2-polyprenyl-6-hydroxyphenyl methylase/3-demethylubiquinone-9 3-methyltransferase